MVCSTSVSVSASRCVCLCLFYQQKLWLWRLSLSVSLILHFLVCFSSFPFWQPLFFSLGTSFLCLSDYFLVYILSLSLAISAPLCVSLCPSACLSSHPSVSLLSPSLPGWATLPHSPPRPRPPRPLPSCPPSPSGHLRKVTVNGNEAEGKSNQPPG